MPGGIPQTRDGTPGLGDILPLLPTLYFLNNFQPRPTCGVLHRSETMSRPTPYAASDTALHPNDSPSDPTMHAAPHARPWAVVSSALLVTLAAILLALWAVLSPPRLGLSLAPSEQGDGVEIVATDPNGPAHAVPAGRLASLRTPDGAPLALLAMDVAEEPDAFEHYALLQQFYERQDALLGLLQSGGPLLAQIASQDGASQTVELRPATTTLPDLPAAFWIQVFIGSASLLIGAWIWSLRRTDAGAKLYAATGASIFLFTLPAAVYSSRELALDGTLLRVLSGINHAGAIAFGVIMMVFFLTYPVRITPAWINRLLFALAGLWALLDIAWLLPSPVLGIHLATTTEMAGILLCALWQWRATRRDPRARVVLKWLGLSVLVGAGGFILTVAAPSLLGLPVMLPQGYAFLFFLLIYAGLGVGVARYRLFELDRWAFRILFYLTGITLLLVLDAALILWLSLDREPALGLSLLTVSLFYLPLRDILRRRFAQGNAISTDEIVQAGVDTAFAPAGEERERQWRDLLQRLFDPLRCEPAQTSPSEPEIRQEGIELRIPGVAGLPAYQLLYPRRGRGLFGKTHTNTMRRLIHLLAQAEAGRTAYERGVNEERRRIAADLHDDVGSRLLTSLHHNDMADIKQTVREALADVRTIATGLAGVRTPLVTALGDLRYETSLRLEQAGITLDWPLDDAGEGLVLDYSVSKNLLSCHREIVSNVIRHAQASRLSLRTAIDGLQLRLCYEDDGKGCDTDSVQRGNGLNNIRYRVAQAQGTVSFDRPAHGKGLRIQVSLPCQRQTG